MTKKATVIGGHGFVGRYLTSFLSMQGWDCWVPTKNDPLLLEVPLGHVFFCAGLTADYVARSYDVVDAHVSCLNQILHKADYESLVYLSSTRLYDSQDESFGDEMSNLILNPNNRRHIYDLSKALGESMCLVVGGHKAKVARLSCVYSDQNDPEGFLPALLRDVIAHKGQDKPLKVDSSPYFARDYVAINDVVDALVKIACFGKEPIYNVGSGENIENAILFARCKAKTGVTIEPLKFDRVSPSPSVSIKRLKSEFGWTPVGVLSRIDAILEDSKC